MRDNMLISIRGKDGHFMGVDLNIEHNINYQKVNQFNRLYFISINVQHILQKFFAGKGVHGTAKHLSDLSPVVPIYRPLKEKFCRIAEHYNGTKHTIPDTKIHLTKLRSKIEETRLFYPQETKEFAPVKDILTVSI